VKIEQPGASGQGEILMRGPNLMKGYYKNEKATAEVIRDGWFHTGDLGFIDRDGMITITGRAKEVIVLPSGKNIYPDEVETRYQNTPLVKEICVLPRYNPDGSLAGLTAAVVPDREELAARKVTAPRERILFELGRTAIHLPSYMHLTDLTLLSEPLPRTRLGKLRRPLIEEMVRKQMKQGSPEEAPELPEETRALLDHPLSRRFLKRLEEITGKPGPFLPSQDLEMDLGFDSLTLMQITAALEQEFALEILDEEAVQIRTVGDILTRLVQAEGQSVSTESVLFLAGAIDRPPEAGAGRKIRSSKRIHSETGNRSRQGNPVGSVKLLFRVRIEGIENIPRSGKISCAPITRVISIRPDLCASPARAGRAAGLHRVRRDLRPPSPDLGHPHGENRPDRRHGHPGGLTQAVRASARTGYGGVHLPRGNADQRWLGSGTAPRRRNSGLRTERPGGSPAESMGVSIALSPASGISSLPRPHGRGSADRTA
jgi:long-chain acyl-CoA synthetase